MRILKITRRYKGRYQSVYDVTYEIDGKSHEHETISRKGTIHNPDVLDLSNIGETIDGVTCIILNERHDAICLIQEYRPAANAWICDVPMGLVEPGESPEDAALRETMEETGLADARVLNVLKPTFVNPSVSDSKSVTVVLEAKGDTRFAEDRIVPMWFELKKIRALLTHENCPPMSSKAQTVLYALAMSKDIGLLLSQGT